ncbi:XdhC family protein [bacterium]|nr:XdhC family protein [bacterium]
MNIKKLIRSVNNIIPNKDGVFAIIYESKGSTPTEIGRMMFITKDTSIGSIGGGIVEKMAIDKAREMLKNRDKTEKFNVDLSGEEGSDGLCGGASGVLLVNVISKKQLILIGAGHVDQALSKFAEDLGYSVSIYDTREKLPWDNYTIVKDYDEVFNGMEENVFIVIATHNHEEDEKALQSLIKNEVNYAYLGAVSSKRKFKIMTANIENTGLKVPENIFAPAGLNLNGNEPIEVALSIVAQIEKIYYNKDGRDLKDVKK